MAYKFFINGQLTDSPDNELELSTTIRRDRTFPGLLMTQEVELKYNENNNLQPSEISGYNYLKGLFDSGVCQEAGIEIYDQVSNTETYLHYKGVIKIPQVKVQEQPVSLSAKIQDNSFFAYVNNNRELKVNLTATRSKNGVPITPLEPYLIDLFDSYTGTFGSTIGAMFEAYRAVDVFRFILAAITDDQIGFRSDYFDQMDPEPFILKGQEILNPATLYPNALPSLYEISFEQIFNELNKCKNLSFYIDYSDPLTPVFRLENTELTYSATPVYSFTDIKEIETTVDTTHLYGTVSAGSTYTSDGQDPHLYPWDEALSYYGWKPESFYPLGQCNTNAELNLSNDWIISNNVIQEIVYGQSTNYNDNYFLIECESVDPNTLTAYAKRYDFFGQPTPPYFYNLGLNNFNKLKRHSDKFEQQFGNFLGGEGGTFKAFLGDNSSNDITYVTAPASNPNFIPVGGGTWQGEFPNETTLGGFDSGGNWDNVTSEYVIPASGDYSFHQHLNFEIAGIQTSAYFQVTSRIRLYDSAMNLKDSDSMGVLYGGGWGQPGNGLHLQDHTWVCNAVIGDIVQAYYSITFTPNQDGNLSNPRSVTMTYQSYFECNGSPEAGISIASGNSQIRKYRHKFEYDIPASVWRAVALNPIGMFEFEKDGITRQGWIDEISRDDWTGKTSVELISSSTRQS